MKTKNNFFYLCKKLKKERSIGDSDLAKEIGISVSTLQKTRAQTPGVNLKQKTKQKFSDFFKLEISEIFKEVKNENKKCNKDARPVQTESGITSSETGGA